MHLDIAAGAFLAIPPETYLMSQVKRIHITNNVIREYDVMVM